MTTSHEATRCRSPSFPASPGRFADEPTENGVSLESWRPRLELAACHGWAASGHAHWWNFLLGLLA